MGRLGIPVRPVDEFVVRNSRGDHIGVKRKGREMQLQEAGGVLFCNKADAVLSAVSTIPSVGLCLGQDSCGSTLSPSASGSTKGRPGHSLEAFLA
jgi:hypothetical protein